MFHRWNELFDLYAFETVNDRWFWDIFNDNHPSLSFSLFSIKRVSVKIIVGWKFNGLKERTVCTQMIERRAISVTRDKLADKLETKSLV